MSEKCKEWSLKESLCDWARSEPSLGGEDLRPYYFASKEKKDYFFNQIKSEKLRYIIDGLSSSAYFIASINDKIDGLTSEEAKYVFDILSQKILGQGDGSKKPDGIDGVIALVKLHKELQSELISLISSFNMDRVGVWICSGWDKCIVDEAEKQKLNAYYAILSQKGSPFVKAALNTVKKRG